MWVKYKEQYEEIWGIKVMNKDFFNLLNGLNSANKLDAVKRVMSMTKEQSALDPRFYFKKEKMKNLMDRLFDEIDASDPFLERLIRIEGASPYSIFTYVLNENYSDIMFYHNGFSLTDNVRDERFIIPEELLPLYSIFITHFIENIMFLSEKKFDTANCILDAEISSLRFNLIHKTLSNNGFDVIIIRKQTVKKTIALGEEYISGVCNSPEQVNTIQKYAQKGNFIIFGEVGSGKTTLLKFMANYKIDEKRNLCIIEDTSELNVDVPISLITNHHRNIKGLFIAALRQNPSSIIIGETRTDEIVDILQAALTISVGTTIHANSFVRAIQRIIFMSIERKIPPQEVLDLTSAAIDCFIFMDKRRVKEVWERKEGIVQNIYEAYTKVN